MPFFPYICIGPTEITEEETDAPATVTLPFRVVDGSGAPASDVVIKAECLAAPDEAEGLGIVAGPVTATTDADGLASLVLVDGAKYSIKAGAGRPVVYIASSSGPMPALIAR